MKNLQQHVTLYKENSVNISIGCGSFEFSNLLYSTFNKPLANVMKAAGQENLVKAMEVFKLTHLDGLCTS